jgi:hypothetical protein
LKKGARNVGIEDLGLFDVGYFGSWRMVRPNPSIAAGEHVVANP